MPVGLLAPDAESVAVRALVLPDPAAEASVTLVVPVPVMVTVWLVDVLEARVAVGRNVAAIECVPTLRAIFTVAVPTAYPCEALRTT